MKNFLLTQKKESGDASQAPVTGSGVSSTQNAQANTQQQPQ
jgi:hypothetical protein